MTAGRSRRLWIVNGVILLVVLLAAGGTVAALTSTSSETNPTLRTTPLGRGTVAETVTASGTVTSATSATLNFSTSGKIAEVRVRLGDHVEKGQTVARLDNEYADANLEAADAQVASAEQQLDDAEYAKDHPQTQQPQPQAPAAQMPAGQTPAQQPGVGQPGVGQPGVGQPGVGQPGMGQPGWGQPAPGQPAPGQPAPAAPPQQQAPPPPRHHGLFGDWFAASGHGVEAVDPAPAQGGATPTPAPGGTGTGSTSGTAGATGSTPQNSEDPGEAQVRQAEATLAQAKANRVQAKQATENLDLVAPQAGTVVSLDGVAGQLAGPQGIVVSSTATGNPAGGRLPDGSAVSSGAGSGQAAPSAGASGGAGASAASGGASGGSAAAGGGSGVTAPPTAPAVMTIADLGSMQVLAQIPELDVGRVANGQPVAVSVNALPGQDIPGTVSTINLLPGSGPTVQYGTAVGMPAPPLGLRPGMSASVAITVRQAKDVTFLPSVAVTPLGGPDSGRATVNVLAPDGTTQQRAIGTGLSSDTVTQVTSGLSMGELVVLPDPNTPNVFGGGGQSQNQGGGSGGQGSARSGG